MTIPLLINQKSVMSQLSLAVVIATWAHPVINAATARSNLMLSFGFLEVVSQS